MRKLRRCSLAVLACIALGIGAGFQAGTAAASDLAGSEVDQSQQTSVSQASASAENESSTSQAATQVQVGGNAGGQSQSTVQAASTDQSATASATAAQTGASAATVGGPEISEPAPSDPPSSVGDATPTDSAGGTDAGGATSAAANVSEATQDTSQTQDSNTGSGGQSQAAAQTATTTQEANATAALVTDDSISPGAITPKPATGTNTNDIAEGVNQTQTGTSGASGAESQSAVQDAVTAQEATAGASVPPTSGSLDTQQPQPDARRNESKSPAKRPVAQAGRAPPPVALSPTAAPSQETEAGGSAGGSGSGVEDVVRSSPTADPSKPKGRISILTAAKAAKSFLDGSAFVAQTIAADLPRATVTHGLQGDGAVMMKIAKLLLLVYAGFLMIWFWATRVRWNGR